MILVDTSAWVEFPRDTGSAVCAEVDELLDGDITTCGPIRMELLAGARDERHLHDLRRLLARASVVATHPPDYEQAAALYRTCRGRGETARKLIDCLIAALALASTSRCCMPTRISTSCTSHRAAGATAVFHMIWMPHEPDLDARGAVRVVPRLKHTASDGGDSRRGDGARRHLRNHCMAIIGPHVLLPPAI